MGHDGSRPARVATTGPCTGRAAPRGRTGPVGPDGGGGGGLGRRQSPVGHTGRGRRRIAQPAGAVPPPRAGDSADTSRKPIWCGAADCSPGDRTPGGQPTRGRPARATASRAILPLFAARTAGPDEVGEVAVGRRARTRTVVAIAEHGVRVAIQVRRSTTRSTSRSPSRRRTAGCGLRSARGRRRRGRRPLRRPTGVPRRPVHPSLAPSRSANDVRSPARQLRIDDGVATQPSASPLSRDDTPTTLQNRGANRTESGSRLSTFGGP